MVHRCASYVLTLSLVASVLSPSAAQEPSRDTPKDSGRPVYGDRTEFFLSLPERFQPEKNWRDYLAFLPVEEEPKFSQGFEELIIRDYFRDMKDGVFLDVGCYRPVEINTTYFLERQLKWSGIAIDAISGYKEEWEKVRPRSQFFAYAITDTDGETVSFHLAMGLSSLDKESPKKALEMLEVEIEPPPVLQEIQVPTITLNTLLEDAGLENIDFLSMDIEGAELLALKGFDIQRFKPALCCIEHAFNGPAIMEYFTKNGYEIIEKYLKVDKINWYFRPVPNVDPIR